MHAERVAKVRHKLSSLCANMRYRLLIDKWLLWLLATCSWREYVRRRRFRRQCLGIVHEKVKRRRQRQVFRVLLEMFVKLAHGTRANRDLRVLEQQLAELRER